MQRVVEESGIMDLDDSNWPEPDQGGRQELEVKFGSKHIAFTCSKVGRIINNSSLYLVALHSRTPNTYIYILLLNLFVALNKCTSRLDHCLMFRIAMIQKACVCFTI